MLYILIFAGVLLCTGISAQDAGPKSHEDSLTIVFYNVENLFDSYDDTLKRDEEFLPGGIRNWHTGRFYAKIGNIAKTLIAVGGWEAPAIIGLCEIENRYVLEKLIYSSPLQSFDYRIIHQESPDARGIDVALLYRDDCFGPEKTIFRQPVFDHDTSKRSRDILYIKGSIRSGQRLHLFVNHWPSKYGGLLETVPAREAAALTLKEMVDSIYGSETDPRILIMGDFNDEPNSHSVSEALGAGLHFPDCPCEKGLYNLMHPYSEVADLGTNKYQGEWSVIDQFICSSALLCSDSSMVIAGGRAHIFCPGFLLEKDERYLGKKPFRTFYGPRYLGGFSDHLPIYVKLAVPAANRNE